MVRKNVSFTVYCSGKNCQNEISVFKLSELKDAEWYFNQTLHSSDEEAVFKKITDIKCPACAEQERFKKFNSLDIRDRIYADYYKAYPEKFKDDAIEHVGLFHHPKAEAAYNLAYSYGYSDGYNSILSHLNDLSELILK
jgi:hypothetical protein